MKTKKRLFPFILGLALLLTAIGLVSANISFSNPTTNNTNVFNVTLSNISTNNIELIGNDNANISYVLNLNDLINEYVVSFDVINESSFNVILKNKQIEEIPEELKDIINTEVKMSEKIDKDHLDKVTIKYTLKNKLTNEEKALINKYNNLKINVLLNYNQE